MHNRISMLFIFSLLLVVVNISCSTKAESKLEKDNAVSTPALPVDAIIARKTTLTSSEKLPGSIIANRSVDIMSELSRKVTAVHFNDGSIVRQGQVLFKLDDADLRAKERQVAAELKLAAITEARLKQLLSSETIRQEEYDIALSKLEALRATHDLMQVEIAKTIIRAPFSGEIGISKAHVGTLVTPGLPLVNLQEQTRLKVLFSVAEKYLPVTKVGNSIRFTTTLDNHVYTATINSTEASVDQQSRNIIVHAVVENFNRLLKPGMSVTIDFNPEAKDAAGIMIPSEALIAGENGYGVFLIKNNQAALVPITVGNRTDDKALITSGISNGDTVMISNLLRASNGIAVSIATLNN